MNKEQLPQSDSNKNSKKGLRNRAKRIVNVFRSSPDLLKEEPQKVEAHQNNPIPDGAENLKAYSGKLAVISNFNGKPQIAQKIVENFQRNGTSEETNVRISIHLTKFRALNGDGLEFFKSSALALSEAFQALNFTNCNLGVEEVITKDRLIVGQLTDQAKNTRDLSGDEQFLHIAIVSAMDMRRIGLDYETDGATYTLGEMPKSISYHPTWNKLRSLQEEEHDALMAEFDALESLE